MDEKEQAVEVNQDVLREEAARTNQKVSTTKVKLQRYPGPLGPVFGPPTIIVDLQKAAESLMMSGFMQPWIVEKIKEHLLEGGTFVNKGETKVQDELAIVPNGQVMSMQVRSEYRMATESEILSYVDTVQFANVTGHKVTKHQQTTNYVLRYHEGPELIERYDALPRQAKVVLDLLNETGRENFSEASIEVVLTEGANRLKTKQLPATIWGFYRRRLIDEGHLEEVG